MTDTNFDPIRTVAISALEAIQNVDATGDDALKGAILTTLFVAKSLGVTKDSFFDGVQKAWNVMDDDATTDVNVEAEVAA